MSNNFKWNKTKIKYPTMDNYTGLQGFAEATVKEVLEDKTASPQAKINAISLALLELMEYTEDKEDLKLDLGSMV